MSTSAPQFLLRFMTESMPYNHPAKFLAHYPDNCELTSGTRYSFHLPSQTIEVVDVLHCGANSSVYLGRCHDGTEVALKFAETSSIHTESGVYDSLTEIQGSVLPMLYGVLYGRTTERKRAACLALERFGNRLQEEFQLLEKVERYARSSGASNRPMFSQRKP